MITSENARPIGAHIFGVPRGVALLLVATFVFFATSVIFFSLFLADRAVFDRTSRALRTVTASDVRIDPVASTLPGVSGRFYERPEGATAVLVAYGLPPISDEFYYYAWFAKRGQIYASQRVRFDDTGAARIAFDQAEAAFYDQVTITREKRHSVKPENPPILTWTRR